MADVWLITGIPGVGKTTTARALAAKLPKSAHIEADSVRDLIISGCVLPGGEPAEEASKQRLLNVRNQCLLARSFAENGFVPVIDNVVFNQERVKEYLAHLKDLSLHLVLLMPGGAVAVKRDEARTVKKTAAAQWIHFDPIMREEFKGMGLWIDNAEMNVDEVVEQILSNQSKALVSQD